MARILSIVSRSGASTIFFSYIEMDSYTYMLTLADALVTLTS